jgi:hypothetical protein
MNVDLEINWDSFIDLLSTLNRAISNSSAINVNSIELRDQAQEVSQYYFRNVRPSLRLLGINQELIIKMDDDISKLFKLSRGRNAKSTYMNLLASISSTEEAISLAKEMKLSEKAYLDAMPDDNLVDDHEQLIIDSLSQIVPSAARSYKQAILDLDDSERISYRGAANELREALREIIDYFAPDAEVMAQEGFQLVKNQTKPTRKQKVRYILRARGMSKTATKVPEGMIEAIDAKVSVVVSATYSRTNISAHVQTERKEVLLVKQYVDSVLSELLSIPKE